MCSSTFMFPSPLFTVIKCTYNPENSKLNLNLNSLKQFLINNLVERVALYKNAFLKKFIDFISKCWGNDKESKFVERCRFH